MTISGTDLNAGTEEMDVREEAILSKGATCARM